MSDDRGNSGSDLLLAFLAGAAAGAVVALLTSPKSGKDMRESLASWLRQSGAGDAMERAVRIARDAVDGRRDA
jgi:gas vesicle protein